MDDAALPVLDDAALTEEAITLLALRLKHEVAVTRALRGPERQEGFLGLFLTEEDAQAMLDELSGRLGVAGGAEALARIEALETALRRRRRADPKGVWGRLARAFALTEAELDVLLMAAAPAIDPRFGRVYGFLNDDMGRRALTPALAHRLTAEHDLDLTTLRALLRPDRPLVGRGLLRVAAGEPLIEAALSVPEPVIERLIGAGDPEPVLARYVEIFHGGGDGEDEVSVRSLVGRDCGAAALEAAGGRALYRLAYGRLAGRATEDVVEIVRAALRAAHWDGALPYLSGFAAAPPSLREAVATLVCPPALLDAPRAGLWRDCGLDAPESEAASTAADGLPLLDRLAMAARGATDPASLRAALAERAARGMDGLAQAVTSPYGLGDLVVSPLARRQLGEFVSWRASATRVLDEWGLGETFNRRRGAVALFRGPPGTGKTMAASVVANALGLPLYRVDLSGLVSKYIGETEKNLEQLFQAAAQSELVLFFDEADALFGKRTEVSDAHDRYANLETSYLLQRIEAQEGLVILATNLQENVDPAFLRRFETVIEFPAPGPADRLRLWRRLAETRAPLEPGVDFGFLAESFELTGGEIRNVALAAAHAAAGENAAIGMAHLVRSVAQELAKQGRPLRRQSFGPHHVHLREARA